MAEGSSADRSSKLTTREIAALNINTPDPKANTATEFLGTENSKGSGGALKRFWQFARRIGFKTDAYEKGIPTDAAQTLEGMQLAHFRDKEATENVEPATQTPKGELVDRFADQESPRLKAVNNIRQAEKDMNSKKQVKQSYGDEFPTSDN